MSFVRWWQDDYVAQKGGQNNLYTITNTQTGHCSKFDCDQETFNIKFNNINKTFDEAQSEITQMFIDLHRKFENMMTDHDYIRVTFVHKDFDRPIGYPFMTKKTLMSTNLQHTFESVIQSYRDIEINPNNEMKAMVVIARTPAGSGLPINSIQNSLQNSPNIITIINDDNLCLIRAVVVAIQFQRNKESLKKNKVSYCKKNLTEKVFKIAKKLKIKDKQCGMKELKKLEVFFKDYQIILFDDKIGFDKTPIYAGKPNRKSIYLLYTNTHFNVIKSIARFYNRSYYCNFCHVAYNNIRCHKCPNLCLHCNRLSCDKNNQITCIACNVQCNNKVCLKLHTHEFCKQINKCNKCTKSLSPKMSHVCLDQKYCRNCKIGVELDHKCYVLTEDQKKTLIQPLAGYIWFDYETYQENGIHKANLIIAEKACIDCIENRACPSNKKECNLFKFYNNYEFCHWLFKPENKSFTAIAHNFQGFDGLFVMKHITETILPTDKLPSIIMNGTKILSLTFKDVRLIDSFSFIPMALGNFSKTFGLNELKKGYWCHLFNKPHNFEYVGDIPDRKFYTPELFTAKKKEEFETWYLDQQGQTFNFKQELENYCISDVKLLKEGTLTFRKNILNLTSNKIDPFHRCITIASVCHLVYRTSLMKPNTIGIVPVNGLNPKRTTSIVARQWLFYESVKDKIRIQHATNGGERKYGPYFVDGVCEETKTIYEFHGCLFHGCTRCFDKNSINLMRKEYFATTYRLSQLRMDELKKMLPEYKFKVMWECEFKKLKKRTNENIHFFKFLCPISDPLNPRDCLFGGRTNSIKLYHKCRENERIEYYDFTSLYPYVQKYCEYPIGQPTIITENFKDFSSYFGLIKCKILPPRKLYFPVLPIKLKNKLFFTLCGLCAENSNVQCPHNDEQRCITGSWVTLEVSEAIKQGYVIKQIYEIWHYDQSSKYNKKSKSGGLFTEYVDLFLKYKQEASGFPEGCESDTDKDKYIQTYFENEGIKLEKSKIAKNPGLRSVMKLMLNSFWGRFGMNTNKTIVKFINKRHEWTKLITDESIEVTDVDFGIPEVLTVFYRHKSALFDGGASNTQTNVILASFVTCHARLKLLSEMNKLGKRVLYHDTDSIIFLTTGKPGEYIPKLGNFLGDLTNELSPEQGYIVEGVFKAPKDYGIKTLDGKTKCTIKGFRLNYATDLKINFEEMRNIVLNNRNKTLKVEQLKFLRKKNEYTINTSIVEKLYSFNYDKRIIKNDYTTRPFGYYRH